MKSLPDDLDPKIKTWLESSPILSELGHRYDPVKVANAANKFSEGLHFLEVIMPDRASDFREMNAALQSGKIPKLVSQVKAVGTQWLGLQNPKDAAVVRVCADCGLEIPLRKGESGLCPQCGSLIENNN